MTTKERAEYLRDLILSERSSSPDKNSGTPLLNRSVKYKKLAHNDPEKREEFEALILVSKHLDKFDIEDISSYISYAQITRLLNDELAKEFKHYLHDLSTYSDLSEDLKKKEAQKRLYILNSIKSLPGFFIDESLIEKQIIIKQYYPWEYAELMASVNLKAGVSLIKELFKKEVKYSILYFNREAWINKFGIQDFAVHILPLIDYLEGKNKQDMEQFCYSAGVYKVIEDQASAATLPQTEEAYQNQLDSILKTCLQELGSSTFTKIVLRFLHDHGISIQQTSAVRGKQGRLGKIKTKVESVIPITASGLHAQAGSLRYLTADYITGNISASTLTGSSPSRPPEEVFITTSKDHALAAIKMLEESNLGEKAKISKSVGTGVIRP